MKKIVLNRVIFAVSASAYNPKLIVKNPRGDAVMWQYNAAANEPVATLVNSFLAFCGANGITALPDPMAAAYVNVLSAVDQTVDTATLLIDTDPSPGTAVSAVMTLLVEDAVPAQHVTAVQAGDPNLSPMVAGLLGFVVGSAFHEARSGK